MHYNKKMTVKSINDHFGEKGKKIIVHLNEFALSSSNVSKKLVRRRLEYEKFDETRTQHLISSLIDENISDEEMKELDELLKDSPEALNMYLSLTKIDMELHQDERLLSQFSYEELNLNDDLPETVNRLRKSLRLFQLVAAFLVAFIGINYLVPRGQKLKQEVNVSSSLVLAHISKISEDIKWSKSKL